MIKKIYLAGFDVFRKDPIAFGADLKLIAEKSGLTGQYPMDNVITGEYTKHELAMAIANANFSLIVASDAVVANANAFRGHEQDSGTMVEVGVAVALGKPVFLYMDDLRPMVDKIAHVDGFDQEGFQIENFDLPLNLMMACSAQGLFASYADAIQGVVAYNKNLADQQFDRPLPGSVLPYPPSLPNPLS